MYEIKHEIKRVEIHIFKNIIMNICVELNVKGTKISQRENVIIVIPVKKLLIDFFAQFKPKSITMCSIILVKQLFKSY